MIESEAVATAVFGCELLPLVARLDERRDCKTTASFESRNTSAFVMLCECFFQECVHCIGDGIPPIAEKSRLLRIAWDGDMGLPTILWVGML